MGKNWLISSPRTFSALGQKECFIYNSGLDFKKKKKINIQEHSELQKGKETEKASSESVLKFLYLFKI